jgi:hypothetical protein
MADVRGLMADVKNNDTYERGYVKGLKGGVSKV